MSDKWTLSRIQELLERYSSVARHGDIEFHIAQVDSIQYPPDVNHGSIRLNSTIAYLYSDKIRTGHHARNVKELVDNQAAIIRQLLTDHETMRRALEFYADKQIYLHNGKTVAHSVWSDDVYNELGTLGGFQGVLGGTASYYDSGDKARKALSEVTK